MAQFSSFCFAVSGEGSFIEKKRRGIRGSLFPKFLFRWSSCCAVTGQGSSQVRDFLPLPSRSPRDPFPFALPPPSSTLRNSFPPLVIPAGVPSGTFAILSPLSAFFPFSRFYEQMRGLTSEPRKILAFRPIEIVSRGGRRGRELLHSRVTNQKTARRKERWKINKGKGKDLAGP